MMTDWLEPFRVLTCMAEKDDAGGMRESWTEGTAFRGAVTAVSGADTSPGARPSLRLRGMLLHDGVVELAFRDRIRRLRDGAEWQVCGEEERMSLCTEETAAAVPVERLVKPL